MTALKILPELAMSLLAVGSWVVLVFELPDSKPPAAIRSTSASRDLAREVRLVDAPVSRASEPDTARPR